jgi:hypothetical protein
MFERLANTTYPWAYYLEFLYIVWFVINKFYITLLGFWFGGNQPVI